MRKPDTLGTRAVRGQWWKHLKEYKRIVHKAERRDWKQYVKHSNLV
jgi:preprotein translocase subunit Sss1